MEHNRRSMGVNVGSASIVMIFAVLCLTVFSTLSFVTANHERKLADKAAASVQQYYEADWKCEEKYQNIYEKLQSGVKIEELQTIGVQVKTEELVHYLTYSVDIDEQQQIQVRLAVLPEGKIETEQWKVVATKQWQYDDHVDVWDGE